ncbi:APC family permease [Candidatus Cytomitobacter primus]|uniref:Arginine/agmatine antiporter n=1 Tax=Candidatus Cytomitobacter primus TaxID=2066024 RepID=A0A5C0UFW2_9PROT|nr:amino acid permease [Candidatus Cytomitobacter primus]QEK38610.1 amino acid permease [Candidatus Cytomitobacter primus]
MSSKKIGFISLTSIIIGNIMGSGVLLLPKTIGKFGIISLWSYAISAVGFLAIGLLYAQMQMWLKCEGVHGPILKVFGNKYGKAAAFLYWLSVVTGNSALFTSLFSYIGFGKISLLTCLSLTSIILFFATLFNCIDLRAVKIVELFVAAVKMIPLIGLPLLCIYYAWKSNVDIYKIYETTTFTSGIQQTLTHTLWAFLGVETAVAIGSKIHNPEKTIARSMIVGMSTIAIAYILGMWAILKILPNVSEINAPYTELLMFIVPQSIRSFASPLIYGLAIFLILGSVYSWIFTTGVIASDSAEQGLFPKFLAYKNRFGAPSNALIVSSLFSLLFLIATYRDDLSTHFDIMINFLTLITFFVHFATNIAFFKFIFSQSKLTIYNLFIGTTAIIANIIAISIIIMQILT